MKRQICALLVLAGVVTLAPGVLAQQAPAGQAPAPRRLVSAIRGEAPMVYMRPVVKAGKKDGRDFIITTIQLKNVATAPIAGLLVEEFWYNKAGTIVTGDNYRHPKPIMPDEVVTVTLETPRTAAMDSNQLKFQHANGAIKMTLVPKM